MELSEVSFLVTAKGFVMRVSAGTLADRLEAPVEIFVDNEPATAPEKVLVRQGLLAMEILMHGWIKQGVLVLAIFRRLTEGDRGSNYFDREFFYRGDGSR
jgi:hypothetical protein